MKRIRRILFIIPLVILAVICINVSAEPDEHGITFKEGEGELTSAAVSYDWQGIHYGINKKQIHLKINANPGKRLTELAYKADEEEEWTQVPLSELHNYANNHVQEVNLDLPISDSTIRFTFVDYEPATISYAKYLGKNYSESSTMDDTNYESEYTTMLTNYKGGDVILPSDCTADGCMLKIEYSKASCDAIKERMDANNPNWRWFGESHDHIDRTGVAAQPIKYFGYTVSDESCQIQVVINKYFTDFGIQSFTIADNINEIMSEDFIGATVESNTGKFDDSIAEDGYMYFTEHNNYTKESSIFYGVNELYTTFYSPRPLNGDIDTNEMGTLIYQPDSVEPGNDEYQITWNNATKKATVTINSYYEQEYKLDLKLMKNEEVLKTIHLNLNRFAFAGNAGNLSLVDDNNNQCMGGPTDNCYYSTEYRGEPDVFYTTGETIALNNYFEWSIQRFEDTERLEGDTIVNPETVYEANKDFHPWAIAMFYNADDEIVKTESFDLNQIKVEGISSTIKPENDEVNGLAWSRTLNDYITGYDKDNYTYVSHGAGKQIQ